MDAKSLLKGNLPAVAELFFIVYVGFSSFDQETGQFNLSIEHLGLLGIGGAAAVAGGKKEESTTVEVGADSGGLDLTEPDFAAIATRPSAESAPVAHDRPDPPDLSEDEGSSEDQMEHDVDAVLAIIESGGDPNYLVEALRKTKIKNQPEDSSKLSPGDYQDLEQGRILKLLSWEDGPKQHLQVGLEAAGENDLYLFRPDVRLLGPDGKPLVTAAPIAATPKQGYRLGTGQEVFLDGPIIPGGNFTWAEATRNGERRPPNQSVVDNIIKIAGVMQEVRVLLGDRPTHCNSWFRDAETNRRVGGASQSRHLAGDAVDFVVAGIHPRDVLARVRPWWGARGGIASATVFTHIDARGYSARWSYGF